jgi:hypothetical protein
MSSVYMLPLEDPHWESMCGGYRIPYDARPALRALLAGDEQDPIWEELWEALHHQGDVGDASYAAVPWLVETQKVRGDLNWNSTRSSQRSRLSGTELTIRKYLIG